MDSPTAPITPGAEASSFTPNETKLICAIMQNLTAEIQFDVDKVALDLGYKNGGSLRARWNSLKRSKISSSASRTGASTGGVDKATPTKKGKATAKKAKAGGNDESTGLKKGGKKGANAKAKKVKTEEEDDAVDSVEGV